MSRPASPFVLALALLIGTLPARASGSASSAASEGSSASVGSLSTSLEGSSNRSSEGDDVAAGDYRVIEVADAADRPGQVRLTLQGGGQSFLLYVPQQAARSSGVAAGQTVTARRHAYGLEFAAGEPRTAFFLALHDAWLPELQTRPVAL